jgi:transcriptional regulator with XRE-family HTH domain
MIRAARAEACLSLRDLAARVQCSPSHLSRLENGAREVPSPRLLTKLATVLKLDRDEVFVAAGRIPGDIVRWITMTPNALPRLRRLQREAA